MTLENFEFTYKGPGHYVVKYTTGRGDYWKALITDMTLIDATKNADVPTRKALKELRNAVKWKGLHYTKKHELSEWQNGGYSFNC